TVNEEPVQALPEASPSGTSPPSDPRGLPCATHTERRKALAKTFRSGVSTGLLSCPVLLPRPVGPRAGSRAPVFLWSQPTEVSASLASPFRGNLRCLKGKSCLLTRL